MYEPSWPQPPNPVGTPRMLFEYETALILPKGNQFSFAASPDRQRFVVNGFASPARPVLEMILNWGPTQTVR